MCMCVSYSEVILMIVCRLFITDFFLQMYWIFHTQIDESSTKKQAFLECFQNNYFATACM